MWTSVSEKNALPNDCSHDSCTREDSVTVLFGPNSHMDRVGIDHDGEDNSACSEGYERVMNASHKEALQLCRETLVENMIPDDLFNHLIANKIFTQADVGRIKEKSTRESVNEELLNNLVLRSDRAYSVFVTSLQKTLQGYLADALDKELNSNIRQQRLAETKRCAHNADDSPSTKHMRLSSQKPQLETRPCKCQQIGRQISEMFKSAFDNITQQEDSTTAFSQFRHELSQTNKIMRETFAVMNSLKSLCKHDDHSSGDSADLQCDVDGELDGTQQREQHTQPPVPLPTQCASCLQTQQIKIILNDAFTNTDNCDDRDVNFEDLQAELCQKNKIFKDCLEVIASLKALCRHDNPSSSDTQGQL